MYLPNAFSCLTWLKVVKLGGKNPPIWQRYLNVIKSSQIEQQIEQQIERQHCLHVFPIIEDTSVFICYKKLTKLRSVREWADGALRSSHWLLL